MTKLQFDQMGFQYGQFSSPVLLRELVLKDCANKLVVKLHGLDPSKVVYLTILTGKRDVVGDVAFQTNIVEACDFALSDDNGIFLCTSPAYLGDVADGRQRFYGSWIPCHPKCRRECTG